MGGKQSISVAIVLKGAGFTDQPVDDVSVLDAVLAFPSQPGYGLYPLLAIPYLQVLHIKTRTLLETLTGEGPERSGTLPEAALAEALAVIEPVAQLLSHTGLRKPAGVLMMQGPDAGL